MSAFPGDPADFNRCSPRSLAQRQVGGHLADVAEHVEGYHLSRLSCASSKVVPTLAVKWRRGLDRLALPHAAGRDEAHVLGATRRAAHA